MNIQKYKKQAKFNYPERTWPDQELDRVPMWSSVDLRDGNQSLVDPMNVSEKMEMYNLLLKMGFKEIEVGFPAASGIEFDFLRNLIDKNLIPVGVTIQVLTQSREALIRKSFESVKGSNRAIIHLYNSTSELQRRVVFKKSKEEIKQIAIEGTKLIKELADSPEYKDTEIVLQYSPESFTGTEMDYAIEVCEAVMNIWQPTPQKKIILNLPATVEMTPPNIYADQIEWFCKNLKNRESALISIHAHNDRGTGVAATEMAILAGADRVEGTIFGNGERTGNADIINLALNFYTQGINPNLDITFLDEIITVYEKCNKMKVGPRHPYAGELVYTAFSGSHQDAINKGMKEYMAAGEKLWEVPYLPVDPTDFGRSFESFVRINSQSGKGGLAYIMEFYFGYKLPRGLQEEFSSVIQKYSESVQREVKQEEIITKFEDEFINTRKKYELKNCRINESENEENSEKETIIDFEISIDGVKKKVIGKGNGPIDAFKNGIKNENIASFNVTDYSEHTLGEGSDAKAVAYIQIENDNKVRKYGAGVDTNIAVASIKSIVSALNRI
jgi:2-isopropylmalate synthase